MQTANPIPLQSRFVFVAAFSWVDSFLCFLSHLVCEFFRSGRDQRLAEDPANADTPEYEHCHSMHSLYIVSLCHNVVNVCFPCMCFSIHCSGWRNCMKVLLCRRLWQDTGSSVREWTCKLRLHCSTLTRWGTRVRPCLRACASPGYVGNSFPVAVCTHYPYLSVNSCSTIGLLFFLKFFLLAFITVLVMEWDVRHDGTVL